MKKYSESVRQFLSVFLAINFGNEQTWQAWLNLKEPEWRDLVALIRSNVRDEFKIRALAILLVPDWRCLPFEWRCEKTFRNFVDLRSQEDMIKIWELPEKLRFFAAELVVHCVSEVLREWKHNDHVYQTLSYYNGYIIDFLKIFSEGGEIADKLFFLYQLNDPIAYEGIDDCSGYNPVYLILKEDIPEEWKELAVAKMHEIIMAEETGQAVPRAEWEKTLECYCDKISTILYGEKKELPYSVELFASQLKFILDLPKIKNRRLFAFWKVGHMLRILQGDHYKKLRHRLAQHFVLENTGDYRFRVYEENTKEAAEAMLAEFRADKKLTVALENLLEEGQKDSERMKKYQDQERKKIAQVLSQMK